MHDLNDQACKPPRHEPCHRTAKQRCTGLGSALVASGEARRLPPTTRRSSRPPTGAAARARCPRALRARCSRAFPPGPSARAAGRGAPRPRPAGRAPLPADARSRPCRLARPRPTASGAARGSRRRAPWPASAPARSCGFAACTRARGARPAEASTGRCRLRPLTFFAPPWPRAGPPAPVVLTLGLSRMAALGPGSRPSATRARARRRWRAARIVPCRRRDGEWTVGQGGNPRGRRVRRAHPERSRWGTRRPGGGAATSRAARGGCGARAAAPAPAVRRRSGQKGSGGPGGGFGQGASPGGAGEQRLPTSVAAHAHSQTVS